MSAAVEELGLEIVGREDFSGISYSLVSGIR